MLAPISEIDVTKKIDRHFTAIYIYCRVTTNSRVNVCSALK